MRGSNASFVHVPPQRHGEIALRQTSQARSRPRSVDWATYRGIGFSHNRLAGRHGRRGFPATCSTKPGRGPRNTRAILLLCRKAFTNALKFMSAGPGPQRGRAGAGIKSGRSEALRPRRRRSHTGALAAVGPRRLQTRPSGGAGMLRRRRPGGAVPTPPRTAWPPASRSRATGWRIVTNGGGRRAGDRQGLESPACGRWRS